jgi:hypothetical protein
VTVGARLVVWLIVTTSPLRKPIRFVLTVDADGELDRP